VPRFCFVLYAKSERYAYMYVWTIPLYIIIQRCIGRLCLAVVINGHSHDHHWERKKERRSTRLFPCVGLFVTILGRSLDAALLLLSLRRCRSSGLAFTFCV